MDRTPYEESCGKNRTDNLSARLCGSFAFTILLIREGVQETAAALSRRARRSTRRARARRQHDRALEYNLRGGSPGAIPKGRVSGEGRG